METFGDAAVGGTSTVKPPPARGKPSQPVSGLPQTSDLTGKELFDAIANRALEPNANPRMMLCGENPIDQARDLVLLGNAAAVAKLEKAMFEVRAATERISPRIRARRARRAQRSHRPLGIARHARCTAWCDAAGSLKGPRVALR